MPDPDLGGWTEATGRKFCTHIPGVEIIETGRQSVVAILHQFQAQGPSPRERNDTEKLKELFA